MMVACFLLASAPNAYATLFISTNTGDWNVGTTWDQTSCSSSCTAGVDYPGSTDSAQLFSGSSVTVTVTGTTSVSNVSILGDTLNINSGITLTVTSNLTLTSTSTLGVGSGILSAGSLDISGSGTNVLTVSTGTVTVSGNVSFSGTAANQQFTATGAATINIGGNFGSGGTLASSTSTMIFNGGSAQTVGTYTTYNNVTMSNTSGGVTLTGTTTFGGNLLVTTGTFNVGAFTFTTTGSTTAQNGGTLQISSTTGTKTFTGNVTVNNGGTWNETANEDIAFSGSLQNDGTFTAGTATHTFSGTTKTISGANTVTIPFLTINGTTTNNGTLTVSTTLAGSSTLTNGAAGTLNIGVSGAITLTTLTASASGNTVNYNLSGAQTVFATTYHHLTLSGSGAKTLTSVTTINGNLALSGTATATTASNLAITGTLDVGNGTTLTTGNVTLAVTSTTTVTGTFTHSGNAAVTFTGDLTVNGTMSGAGTGSMTANGAVAGTGTINLTGNTFEQRAGASKNFGTTSGSNAWTFNNLTFSDSAASTAITFTTQAGTGAINISGTLLIGKSGDAGSSPTTLNAGSSRTWALSGSGTVFTVLSSPQGVLTASTSTFDYTYTNASPVGVTVGGATYNNLRVGAASSDTNAAVTYTLGGNTTASGTLTVGHASSTNSDVLDGSTFTLTLSGSGSPFSFPKGTFTASSSTVNFTGTSATTVNAITYNNLGVGTTSDSNAVTFTFASGTTTVGATLTIGNSGSGANDTLTAITNNSILDVNGDVTITSKGILVADDTQSFTVAGNWTNSGTFTNSSATVTFDTTNSGHTINAGSSQFYNVTFNGSGGVWSPTTNSLNINHDLVMTAGTLNNSSGTPSDISVLGGNVTGNGTISLTANAFVVDGAGNFGGNTAWSFNNLRFQDTSSTTTATGSGGITVASILTIDTSHTLDAGSKTWVLSGSGTPFVVNASATFTGNASTVQYTGTSATNITSTTYNNLSLIPAGSVTYTLGTAGSQTINVNDLTIGNGTNAVSVNHATWDPTLNIAGNLTIAANAGTFTKSDSPATITLKPTGAKTWTDNTNQDLGIIVIGSGASTPKITLGSNTKASKITVSASHEFDLSNRTLILTASGTGGSRPFIATGTFTYSTGTVDYEGTGTTDLEITTYYGLTIGNSGTFQWVNGTYYIKGNMNVGPSSPIQVGTVEVIFSGGMTQTYTDTGGNFDMPRITISSGGAATTLSLQTVMLTDGVTIDPGQTFSIGSQTVRTFTEGTGASRPFKFSGTFSSNSNGTVAYGGGANTDVEAAIYGNLRFIAYGGGNLTANGAVTVTGDLDVAPQGIGGTLVFILGGTTTVSGTVTIQRTSGSMDSELNANGYNLTTGSLNIGTGGTFTASTGTHTLTSSGTPLTVTGTFTPSTSTIQYTSTSATNITPTTYNNLSLIPAGSVTYTLGTATSQTIRVNGNFTVGNGTNALTLSAASNDPTLDFYGDATLSANTTYTAGTNGVWRFNLAGIETLTDSNSTKQDLGNVRLAGGGGVTLKLGSDITCTILRLNAASNTLDFNGTHTLTLTASGTGGSAPFSLNGGTLTPSTGTINYIGSSTTDVEAATYNNLGVGTTSDGGTAVTYTFASGTTTVGGTLTIGNSGSTNSDTLTALTNNSILDVNGNVTITSKGILVADDTQSFTIAGNWTNNGTFTHSSGTVTFDTTGTSTITGATTFNNFTCTTPNKTLQFQKHTTGVPVITFAGTFTITGTSGNLINIYSDTSATQWKAHFNSTQNAVTYANIRDGGCDTGTSNVNTVSSTSVSNNASCWVFTGIYSGTVYSNEGTTVLTTGPTVRIKVNGAGSYSAVANGSGVYTVNGIGVAAGNIVSIFLDGASEKAVTITRASGTGDVSGLNLYQDRVILRHEDAGPITNANLDQYDDGQNTDMQFTVTGSNVVFDNNIKLIVWTGKTYTPGGTVTTSPSSSSSSTDGDLLIQSSATLSMGGNALSVGGDYVNSGTFTSASNLTTFTATATGHVLSGTLNGSSAFYKVSFNGSGGAWTIQDPMKASAANATDTFEIHNGTVTLGNGGGDHLEILGELSISDTAGETGTLQTMSGLAQGDGTDCNSDDICIDINSNSSPPACDNCKVTVGATSGGGQGTLRLLKNSILRLNPSLASSSQLLLKVNSTGYLEVLGSQDATGTSNSTTNETTLTDSTKSWTVNEHVNKVVRMTSGLSIGRLYAITANTATALTRASTATSSFTASSITGSGTEPTRTVCASSALAISADREEIGRYLYDQTGTTGYLKIADSTNNDAGCSGNDSFKIIAEPDAFTILSASDTVAISDAVKQSDTYEILDYAAITAEAGTACNATINESSEAYIEGGTGSEILMRYADVCNMGASAEGIVSAANGANANEGFTIDKSRLRNNLIGAYLYDASNNSTANSKGITNNDISSTRDGSSGSGIVVYQDSTGGNNNTISGNRIYHSGGGNNGGITLSGSVSGNAISSNYVYENGDPNTGGNLTVGILITGGGTSNTVSSNHVYNNLGVGVVFYQSSGNTASSNVIYSNNSEQFTVAISNNNTISSNQIYSGSNGIFFNDTAINNSITGNTIYDVSNGIYLYASASSNNRIGSNTIHHVTGTGIGLADTSGNIVYSNQIYNADDGIASNSSSGGYAIFQNVVYNTDVGILLNTGSHVLFGNQTHNNNTGLLIQGTAASSTIAVNEAYGSGGDNGYDIGLSATGAAKLAMYNSVLSSAAEASNTNYNDSGSYVISRKHDGTNGSAKIWGEYSVSAANTETPQSEETAKFNYADASWEKSVSPHVYSGTGTEDTNLDYDVSSATLSGGPYNYQVVVKTAGTCGSAVFDVYRNGVDVGDANCGSQFTDTNSSVNMKFKVDGGGTAYVVGDAYAFTVWDAASDTNVDKTTTLTQTISNDVVGLTVPSGTTLQFDGASGHLSTLGLNLAGTMRGFTVNGTLSGGYNDITTSDVVDGTGTISLTTGSAFRQRVVASENFGTSSGSTNWTFYDLLFENSSGSNRTITPRSGGTGSIIVDGTMTVGKSSDSNTTRVNDETNDRILDINGSVNVTTKGILDGSSTASFTVGGNWTNSNTFTANTGTVTFDTTTTGKTLSGNLNGSSKFNVLTFNGSGGEWTLGANLLTGDNLNITAGTLKNGDFSVTGTAAKTLTVSNGAFFEMSGTSVYPTVYSTFTYGATSTVRYLQSAATAVVAATYGHLDIGTTTDGATGVTYTLASGTTTLAGNLTIGNATSTNADTFTAITNNSILDANGDITITSKGTLVADDTQSFTVFGNWTNNGTFTHSSGTVTFDGTGTQTIAGSSTFYNLLAAASAARTLQFTAGTTQSIASGGSVTFTGASGQLLTLASTSPGTEWNLQANNGIASQNIQYVSVADSNAGPFGTYAEINATDLTSTDGGNNTNWDFGLKANGFLTYF